MIQTGSQQFAHEGRCEEIVRHLAPFAHKSRSVKAYIYLLTELKEANASKEEILTELDNMEFYHQIIRAEIDDN